MTKKETEQLAIARAAIEGRMSWLEAARRLKVSNAGVYMRICSLLRKAYADGTEIRSTR